MAHLDFAERARIRNREVGFIFQSFNLIGDLTVYENVELPLTYRGMGGAERKKRAEEALEKVGMAHRMKHYPVPQALRAASSSASPSPGRLSAESPRSSWPTSRRGTSTPKNGDAVMGLLSDLHQEGATICMVTHDPRFASHAGRSVHLFDGRIVEETAGAGNARS